MKKFLRLSFVALLSLIANVAMADEATFDWTGVTEDAKASEATVYTDGGITLTFDIGTHTNTYPSVYVNGTAIRMYKGNTLQIDATDGYVVTGVVFTPVSSTYSASKLTYNDTAISDEWTLDEPAQSITLSATAAARFQTIVVTYVESSGSTVVSAPTISGTTPFASSTTVTITGVSGASLYYTTDGTDPTTASTAYSEPFELTEATTVKAIAVKDEVSSSVAEKTFEAITTIATDIDDFKSMTTGTIAILELNNVEVLYADDTNRSVYVRDDTGGICFYYLGLGLTTGDIINGSVAGKVAVYNNLPEMTKVDATSADNITITSSGNTFEPKQITIADALTGSNICDLVQITDVKLDSVGNYLYAYSGTDSLQIYDSMKVLSDLEIVAGGEGNSVTGILVPYYSYYELYPTTIENIVTTAVSAIETSDNEGSDATYNLAGQRVGDGYKGVIIRKGKKFVQK